MKIKLISLFLFFIFASTSFAWEMENYTELSSKDSTADTTVNENKALSSKQESPAPVEKNEEKPFKRHTLSVGYGIFTISDFAGMIGSAIVSMFGAEDSFGTLGALSVDYGYKVGEVFETGLVFNYAKPIKNSPLYTIMPRAKLNFNSTGFFNPFMELDFGVSFYDRGATPMIHTTLLGLEMGRTFPLTINILSFGQRGIFFASLGCKF